LIGNKSDRDHSREVSYEEGQNLAEELIIPFMETSVEEKVNIEDAIISLLKLAKEKIELKHERKCVMS
jgi:hypothetical protein